MDIAAIERTKEHFGNILQEHLLGIEEIKNAQVWIDYSKLKPIIVGIHDGNGIGTFISVEARKIMEFLLKDEIESKEIEIRDITGLTFENRAIHNQLIPDDMLTEIKKCHVTLNGPTTTPKKGEPWPNIENCIEYAKYLMEAILDPKLEER